MTATTDLVATAATEPDFDELALSIVVTERIPMRLLGADRVEAVRRLIDKKVPAGEIARLLCTSSNMVQRIRSRHDLPPAAIAASSWWDDYLRNRKKRRLACEAAAIVREIGA